MFESCSKLRLEVRTREYEQRTMVAKVLVGSFELAISSRVRPLQTSYYRPSFCPWQSLVVI